MVSIRKYFYILSRRNVIPQGKYLIYQSLLVSGFMRTSPLQINFFDLAFRILLILLPFTTLLSVWTEYRLGFSGFSFYKEALIIVMFLCVAWYHLKGKLRITWWWLDWLIIAYMGTLILVTLFTTGLPGLIYGGRYDFSFLVTFWVIFHGSPLLEKKTSYYLQLFLISAGIMLFFSGLLKWPLTEDILLYFGYCGNPSNWQACNGIPPIFHGIDGANVRRFQGILDGPNTMWAFLILFSGIFAYYMRVRPKWYFVTGIILMGLFGMIIYTYSRSALIGSIVAIGIAVLASIWPIYRRYKKQFIITSIIIVIIGVVIGIKYAGNGTAIIGRAGSTKWHFERMITSIHRFQEHPLGQWLASSGPAYRYVHPEVNATNMEEMDRFYIPESWFLQQFVEGWLLGGMLFIFLMVWIFILLLWQSGILAGMFAGILTMNLFLHTFESSVLVLSLFLLIGLILGHTGKRKSPLS